MHILIRQFKKIWVFLLSILILYVACKPLFVSFVRGNADGLAQRFRLFSFEKSLSQGYVHPRWNADAVMGYGAPLFLYNYPLPYYAISLIHFLGIDFFLSIKLFQSLTLILSFVFMYKTIRSLWGCLAGIVAATVYVLAPFHLMTVYLYDSWGEMTAFVFPPLILYLFLRSKKKKNASIRFDSQSLSLVISWSVLIFSHNVSALLFTPLLLLFGVIFMWGNAKKIVYRVFTPFVLAALISSFFWLPAFVLKSFINYPQFIAHEVAARYKFYQSIGALITVAFQTIKSGVSHYYDFTMGLPFLLAFFMLIALSLYRLKKLSFELFKKKEAILILTLGLFFIFSIFCMGMGSDFLWASGIFNYVGYPYRFLMITTLSGSILVGYLVKRNVWIAFLFLIISLVSSWPYLHPYASIFPFPESYFSQEQTYTYAPGTSKGNSIGEFLPIWSNSNFLHREEQNYLKTKEIPEQVIFEKHDGKLLSFNKKMEDISIKLEMYSGSNVILSTHYFPNWELTIDGTKKEISHDLNGRIQFFVPVGTHDLHLTFQLSPVEKIGWVITCIGGILLLFSMLRHLKRRS